MEEPHQLVELRAIPLSDLASLEVPSQKIHSDYDVEAWKGTQGYKDYALYLRRLNEAVVGCYLPLEGTSASTAIDSLIALLDVLDGWIDEIPPLETPQRFGNLAFRTWGQRFEDGIDALLRTHLPAEYEAAIPHVRPYLLTSFGSFIRMDYGTGHEASFALFLLCLTLLRFLTPSPAAERAVVLRVFTRYLRLCWRLQDTYSLEPAGSHGVWGLDDSCFLPYIFGSGQLRDQTAIPVNAVLKAPLQKTNLYFMAIERIREVKRGPFHEHSSQLYSIAVGVPNWGKVNKGLFKMYEAEVLGKRVVVQHVPLGGLLEWGVQASSGAAARAPAVPQTGTQAPSAAPWAATQAPWARSRMGPPTLPR
ncbi:Phosphotyrosyl phosphatase activator [Hymenopellis radicata]|nr:Phosphotyrosyl phosphatase activator [Hymenopellis radicata]